jgi:hypothetical protein
MDMELAEEADDYEQLLCHVVGDDGSRADFMGGVRHLLPNGPSETWAMEPFLVDSGTRSDSAIPREMVDRLKLPIHGSERTVRTANGVTTSAGFVLIYVKLDLRSFNLGEKIGRMKCFILPDIPQILIGLKDIERFQLTPVISELGKRAIAREEIRLEEEPSGFQCFPISMDEMLGAKSPTAPDPHHDPAINAILERFISVFADKLDGRKQNSLPPLNLELKNKDTAFPPSLQARPRTQPLAWEAEITSQLKDYIDQGIIEPCSSTFWSQILMVKKADGKLRLCVDYRFLNKLLKHDYWPLPNIQELIRKLRGNQWFGKVDMTQGYHQMSIGRGSELTAFRVNGAIYKFKKVPFGLQSAPPVFQMAMQTQILGGLEDICLVYLDDCIIFGRTKEEYLRNMQTVLQRLEEKGILIKRSKCQFGLRKIMFLGHEISGDTVSLSDDRKKALNELAQPKTISQLRSFLGMSKFFRQFIAGYAEMSRDLHQLAAKSPSKILAWTPKLIEAWKSVKAAVIQAPELALLTSDESDQIIMYTDASDFAYGGHLVQRQNGVERSILFYSKTFNPVQARWSTSDKEMYAIVHGVLSNRFMLMGRRFIIRSDHKALMFNDRVSASSKIERWKVALSEYDIAWEFIEGKANVVADALSRVVDVDIVKLTQSEDAEGDDEFTSLRTCLILNELSSEGGSHEAEEISVTTAEFKRQQMKKHHSPAHFGPHDTYESLRDAGFQWKGMKKDTSDFCDSCRICQMIKHKNHTSSASNFTLKKARPGEEISMDIMEYDEDYFGYAFILVLVDSCHSYTNLIPLKSLRVAEIYHALIHYFCNDGLPDALRFDRGSSLTAKVIDDLLQYLQINAIVTAPRSKEENGIAEQKIAKVREVMRLLLEECVAGADPLSWSLVVPYAQRIINITTNTDGFTPAEVRFGLFNRLDRVKEIQAPDDVASYQKEIIAKISDAQLARDKRKPISEGSIFKKDEKVIIKNPIYLKRNAAHKPYLGPFRVDKQTGTSVWVISEENATVRKEVKTSEVFRFKSAPQEAIDKINGLKTVPAKPSSVEKTGGGAAGDSAMSI